MKPKLESYKYFDYKEASLQRYADAIQIKEREGVSVYSLYTVGVAFECFLRATRKPEITDFDDKHSLLKLYEHSIFPDRLNVEERSVYTAMLKEICNVWDNKLRYTSERKLKKAIGHALACSKNYMPRQDIINFGDYLTKNYGKIFEFVNKFLTKGYEICQTH